MSYDVDTERGLLISLQALMVSDPNGFAKADKAWKRAPSSDPIDEISKWLSDHIDTNLYIEYRWDGYGDLHMGEEFFEPGQCYIAFLWRPGNDKDIEKLINDLKSLKVSDEWFKVKEWAFGG
jgi:hypothetical protein